MISRSSGTSNLCVPHRLISNRRDEFHGGCCTSSPFSSPLSLQSLPNTGHRVGLIGGMSGPSAEYQSELVRAVANKLASIPGIMLLSLGGSSMHHQFVAEWQRTRLELGLASMCCAVLKAHDLDDGIEPAPFTECQSMYVPSHEYIDTSTCCCDVFLVRAAITRSAELSHRRSKASRALAILPVLRRRGARLSSLCLRWVTPRSGTDAEPHRRGRPRNILLQAAHQTNHCAQARLGHRVRRRYPVRSAGRCGAPVGLYPALTQ